MASLFNALIWVADEMALASTVFIGDGIVTFGSELLICVMMDVLFVRQRWCERRAKSVSEEQRLCVGRGEMEILCPRGFPLEALSVARHVRSLRCCCQTGERSWPQRYSVGLRT